MASGSSVFDSKLHLMCATNPPGPSFRYTALGWNVVTIDGSDMHAIATALDDAKSKKNGKPSLIIAKTVIGKVSIIPAYPYILCFDFRCSSIIFCLCVPPIYSAAVAQGIPKIEGTKSAHGKAGIPYINDARAKLGLPDEKWCVFCISNVIWYPFVSMLSYLRAFACADP